MKIPEQEEDNKKQALYDFETICTLCQCVPGTHVIFSSCPIMDNNPICNDCCITGCLKNDIAEKFSKTLGKEITLAQVNETCKNCGKNYACQNAELAAKLEKASS